MQTELSTRIEKIWAMADIAMKHGHVDFGVDGHCKIVRLAGLKFKFMDGVLMRVRGHRLDVAIVHHKPQDGIVFFPGAQTIVQFLIGDDKMLSRYHNELNVMQQTFSAKAA